MFHRGSDPFIDVLRDGARKLIEQAIHAKSVEAELSRRYLKRPCPPAISSETPAAPPRPNARGLSAKTITRPKADRGTDHEAWRKRDLGARRFPCIPSDGVCVRPRTAEQEQGGLVAVGADTDGRKALLAMTDGVREGTRTWREVLLDLKRPGLKQGPGLAMGGGVLGVPTALREVSATTRAQRCRVPATMNALKGRPGCAVGARTQWAAPKSVQARGHPHDLWHALGTSDGVLRCAARHVGPGVGAVGLRPDPPCQTCLRGIALLRQPLGCPVAGLRGASQPIEPDPDHAGVGNGARRTQRVRNPSPMPAPRQKGAAWYL